MTTKTMDFWVVGSYEVSHRPAPRHRVVSTFVKEEIPVSIRVIPPEKAPIVIDMSVRDRSLPKDPPVNREFRLFEGSFWRPFRHYSFAKPLDVDQFATLTANGGTYSSSPFLKGRAENTRDTLPGVVLSDKRNSFASDMADIARSHIILDGIVYERIAEPVLTVYWSPTNQAVRINMDNDTKGLSTFAVFRIDQMEAAINAATRFSELDASCPIDNEISYLQVDDGLPLRFDPYEFALQQIGKTGAGAFDWREIRYLSDDALSALLELRRLRTPAGTDESRVDTAIQSLATLENLADMYEPEHRWLAGNDDWLRHVRHFATSARFFQVTVEALHQHDLTQDLDAIAFAP